MNNHFPAYSYQKIILNESDFSSWRSFYSRTFAEEGPVQSRTGSIQTSVSTPVPVPESKCCNLDPNLLILSWRNVFLLVGSGASVETG